MIKATTPHLSLKSAKHPATLLSLGARNQDAEQAARHCFTAGACFASRRVTRGLKEIVAERGQRQTIRRDNGPELTSRHYLAWCVERRIELVHIQRGKPTQNAHVGSFHGRLREECLTGGNRLVGTEKLCHPKGGRVALK
jgi:transposase InsO family protein